MTDFPIRRYAVQKKYLQVIIGQGKSRLAGAAAQSNNTFLVRSQR